ncbi:MAG: cation transporting ATPase C-terminal domain-containing protein, partial [Selenomonadaceae bacterium]|nr:cation transporting ATPase C-terminal domain-containing protein [Selenomonadaceae bacterium]
NNYMFSAIGTGALCSFVVGLIFLLTDFSRSHFRDINPEGVNVTFGGDSVYVLTGYFAFFIFMAVFNAFNARTDRMNLFDNIGGNPGFLKVMGLIVVVQVIMTYFGGAILRCYGLTASEWLFVLAMAFIIIPVDLARKAIIGK